MNHTLNQKALVLTLEQVASLVLVKPITVRRLVQRKKLRRIPGIRHIRIPVREVERFALGTPE